MRAQTELPALAVAFVLLTGMVVAGIVLANSALTSAERPALEEQTATSLSERLVSEDSPHTVRQNVLSGEELEALNETVLRNVYNLPEDAGVEIRVDDETVVETATVETATTVERIVLVERRTLETIRPDFDSSRTVTLPRRTSNSTLTIDPPQGTAVERVVANDRVVLANESGLDGTFDVSLSPFETTALRFESAGILDDDSVEIVYEPSETVKVTLQVSVDV